MRLREKKEFSVQRRHGYNNLAKGPLPWAEFLYNAFHSTKRSSILI